MLRPALRQILFPTPAVVASSGFAFIAGTNAFSTDFSNITTSAINTTGANLLVLVIGDIRTVAQGTVSDSKSNTWTALTLSDEGNVPRARLYYSVASSVGSGHTFTFTGSASFPSLGVAAFSGAHATPFDVETTGSGNDTTPSAGTGITPSQNNELIIAGVGHSATAGTITAINSSFNIVGTPTPRDSGGSGCFGSALAYLIQGSAAAVDPDWTLDVSGRWAAAIASFKKA